MQLFCANVSITITITGNFSKFSLGKKRGKYVKWMGFHWIFTGIPQFGKMQQNPFLGQEEPKIYPIMGFFRHNLFPVVRILLCQSIPNAVILLSPFSPITGFSLYWLSHNARILLSQIYPNNGIFLLLNFPKSGILSQMIPNSGITLCLSFSQYWDIIVSNYPQ